MLRIGMFLGGRYEILEHIGTGGMSDVYKAKCHKLNRPVAIKVLKEEFNADNSFVSKFKAEAQASACLSHPNIVNVYDVGDEVGLHYIVMELVEGITLKNYIAKKGHLEVRETIGIAIQVAQGMEAAHEQKIVHRDIKPQNIMISKEGKVKVTDFGIARAASGQTISSSAMGSVHYISPEQARGGYCDERSDLYSLGISMYEMLTGRVPFEGESAVAVAMSHIQKEPVSPKKYNGNIPISLEKIILKCIQKRPEQRYQSATALITDLKHALLNPNEDFVKIIPLVRNDAPTMIMSEDELTKIKEGSRKVSAEDAKAEQMYLMGMEEDMDGDDLEEALDEDDLEDFELDEEERIASRNDKIFTGVLIGIAVVVVLLVFLIFGKLFGLFGDSNTPATESSSTASEDMTEVPDLLGCTLKQAETLLKESSLGKYVAYAYSDEYEEGEVIAFGTGEYDTDEFVELSAGDKIEKHTTITIVLSSGKSMITIPDVLGMTESQAKAALVNQGFTSFSIEKGESDDYAAGEVYKVSPSVGKQAPADGQVILYISTGMEQVEVPDLSKYAEEDMDQALTDLGLVPNPKSQNSDTVAEGHLISQEPKAGTMVDKGSKVTYIISSGKKYLVPNVTKWGEAEAKAELEAAGYKVEVKPQETDKNSEIGQVIKQNYPGGTEKPKGTTIIITVGIEKQEGTTAAGSESSTDAANGAQ